MPGPGEALAIEERRQSLWDTAAELLDHDGLAAMWLHYVEELSTAEVAAVLGPTRTAVKTLLFRARQRLEPHVRAFREVNTHDEDSARRGSDRVGTKVKVSHAR